MINIFRHIRSSMIKKESVNKYILYALGEILLVVIGILIALQINTWNEERILDKKTKTYLAALNSEVELNIDLLKEYHDRNHADIVECSGTLFHLHSDGAIHYNDSILSAGMTTRPVYKATLGRSTFDDLINAGTLEYVTDLSLKNKIISIQSDIEHIDENYVHAKNVWEDYQLPYLMQHSNVAGNWDSINNVPVPKLPYERDKAAFVNNKKYASILTLRMKMMGNYEYAIDDVRKNFIELSDHLKIYIEKK